MKKIFSFLLLVLFCMVGFSSCGENKLQEKDNISIIQKGGGFNTNSGVCVIDSCEYVYISSGYQGFLAHKGNCKYCEQRRKREQDKLVERVRELLKSEEQTIQKPIENRVFNY